MPKEAETFGTDEPIMWACPASGCLFSHQDPDKMGPHEYQVHGRAFMAKTSTVIIARGSDQ